MGRMHSFDSRVGKECRRLSFDSIDYMGQLTDAKISTYAKVWQSIQDDIRQPALLKALGEAAASGLYRQGGEK